MFTTVQIASVLAALALLQAAVGAPQPALQLRFHHVHVRVEDPGEALDDAADRLAGTKTILQGHGTGVRVGEEYVIVDRVDPRAPDSSASQERVEDRAAAAYVEALAALRRRGATVRPDSLTSASVIRGIPYGRVDAIAFAVPDLRRAVDALAAAGLSPASRSADVAKFRLESDLVVEVIEETEGADAFWCPMHPAIRAPGPRSCPVCGMALVPMPPPRVGQYVMDVTVKPGRNGRGIGRIRLVVRDPETGQPVRQFLDVHERPLHLFVVSSDLERFAHLHPAPRGDGSFELEEAFDDGRYLLVVDFVPAGGTPQMLQKAVVTAGYRGPIFTHPVLEAGPASRTVDGVRVSLDAARATALEPSRLAFSVADAASGKPATDLEPYLGAAGHLLIVDPELTIAIHAHPEGTAAGGPDLAFDPILPAPGLYKMWLQLQRRGRIVTVPFVIEAR